MFLNVVTIVVALFLPPVPHVFPTPTSHSVELSTGLSTLVDSFVVPVLAVENGGGKAFWEEWCLTQECLVSVMEDLGVSMTQEQMVEHGKDVLVKTLSKAVIGIVVESVKVFIISTGVTFGVILAVAYVLVWWLRVRAKKKASLIVPPSGTV